MWVSKSINKNFSLHFWNETQSQWHLITQLGSEAWKGRELINFDRFIFFSSKKWNYQVINSRDDCTRKSSLERCQPWTSRSIKHLILISQPASQPDRQTDRLTDFCFIATHLFRALITYGCNYWRDKATNWWSVVDSAVPRTLWLYQQDLKGEVIDQNSAQDSLTKSKPKPKTWCLIALLKSIIPAWCICSNRDLIYKTQKEK